MSTKIKFYFDPVSPWAYLALTVLRRYVKPWDLKVEYCPVFLGGVMLAAKNDPPIANKNKGAYMLRRRPVDPDPAKNFPPSSVYISRLLILIKALENEEKLLQVMDLINQAYHIELNMKAFSAPEWYSLLVPAAFSKERLDELVAISNTTEHKEKLKREAGEMAARGAYGCPWWEIERPDGAVLNLFGSDRFEVLAWWLGKQWNGPYPDGRKVKPLSLNISLKL
ncbi:thioredoxin-like protein [Atractiella rhizophila]|nr:thioredoxin-like protein [Atractiella rhizophila]